MADTLNDLTSALQQYVVSPLNAFGMGGLVFDVQGESMAMLNADITDHYTEDNMAVQDHIALKPKKITLKGYVGELVHYGQNTTTLQPVQLVTQKLTEISAYIPAFTAAAQQEQEAIAGIDSAAGTLQSYAATVPGAANIYGLVKQAIGAFGPGAGQEGAYQYFAACQSGKILMGIQTPWEFLTNMAIESIVAIQSEDSIFMTDFAVTFKQMRFAETQTATTPLTGTGGTAPTGGATASPINSQQASPIANDGITPGIALPSLTLPTPQSLITGASSLFNNPYIYPIFKAVTGIPLP